MLVNDLMTVAGRIEPHAKGDHGDNRAMLDPPDERLDVEAAAARFQAGDQEVWSWLRGFLIHEQEFSARRLSAGDVFPGSLLPKAEALAHTVAEEPDWSVESTWWLDDRALTVHVMYSHCGSGDVWSGLCRAPLAALRGFARVDAGEQAPKPGSGPAPSSPLRAMA